MNSTPLCVCVYIDEVYEDRFHHQFSFDVWVGIVGRNLIGLTRCISKILEETLDARWCTIMFQFDCSWVFNSNIWRSLYWSRWATRVAYLIIRLKLPGLYLMGISELIRFHSSGGEFGQLPKSNVTQLERTLVYLKELGSQRREDGILVSRL